MAAGVGLCLDAYEPDNQISRARPVLVGSPPQPHTFDHVGDEDWATFYALNAHIYIVQIVDVGLDVAPCLELFDADGEMLVYSCPAPPILPRLEWIASTEGVYFVRVRNQDPIGYGCQMSYSLSILEAPTSAEVTDAYEPDDTPEQASQLQVDLWPQAHNFGHPGDQDWVFFHAQAGKVYVMTTSDLGPKADTVLALYAPDGLRRLCTNDDAWPGSRSSRIVWLAPDDAVYFLRVREAQRRYGLEASYHLQVTTFQGQFRLFLPLFSMG